MGKDRAAVRAQSYMTRTGSHSTKPFKTGDNAHLATRSYDVQYTARNAIESLSKLDALITERDELKIQLAAIMESLNPINEELTTHLTWDRFTYLSGVRKQLTSKIVSLQARLAAINKERIGVLHSRVDSADKLFRQVAKEILPADVFQEIVDAFMDALGEDAT